MKRAKQRPNRSWLRQPKFVMFVHSDWSYDLFGKYRDRPVLKPQLVQTAGIELALPVPSVDDIANAKHVIDIRAEHRRQLADWFAKQVIYPFIEKCKSAGMSDSEAVTALNASLFRDTRGLHGF